MATETPLDSCIITRYCWVSPDVTMSLPPHEVGKFLEPVFIDYCEPDMDSKEMAISPISQNMSNNLFYLEQMVLHADSKYICVEGSRGCGKSTFARFLSAYWSETLFATVHYIDLASNTSLDDLTGITARYYLHSYDNGSTR